MFDDAWRGRRLIVSAIGLAAVIWAVTAAAPATPEPNPTLGPSSGFEMVDTGSINTTASCDPGGTSTVSFSATGTASGPFPGALTVSGSYSIGPQTMPGGSQSNDLPVGQLLSFQETFTISSGSTTITGTTQLTTPPPGFSSGGGPVNSGACTSFADWTLSQVTHAYGSLAEAQAYVSYQAQIQTPAATYADSGESFTIVDQQQVTQSSIGPFVAGEFFEYFLNGASTLVSLNENGSTTQTASGGSTITTDPANLGATADVPLQTSLTLPADAGTMTVSITAQATDGTAPSGFGFFGKEVLIDNGGIAADASSPYLLTFTVDSSLLGDIAPGDVQVFRNGAPVMQCVDATANPDPCMVGTPSATTDGDALVTVRTTHFSTWNLGKLAYAFNGFLQPVDNLPTLNTTKAGNAIPVKFSLNGNQGLNVFQAGYPTQNAISCVSGVSTDAVEQTVTAGGSSLSYDAKSDTYTYVWKTDKAWAGTCRELALTFRDGTTKRAHFSLTK